MNLVRVDVQVVKRCLKYFALCFWFKMADEITASSKPEGALHGVDAVVPKRIAECLESLGSCTCFQGLWMFWHRH